MQSLEISCAARRLYTSLDAKWLNVAPDDGLMIVRNMYSHLMKNKDYSQESVYLVGL